MYPQNICKKSYLDVLNSIFNMLFRSAHKKTITHSILKTYAISSLERLIFFFSSWFWPPIVVFLRRLPIVIKLWNRRIWHRSSDIILKKYNIHNSMCKRSQMYVTVKLSTQCEPVFTILQPDFSPDLSWSTERPLTQFSCKLLLTWPTDHRPSEQEQVENKGEAKAKWKTWEAKHWHWTLGETIPNVQKFKHSKDISIGN